MIRLYKTMASLPVTQVFGIAMPIMASNISIPLVSLVDSAMMGHLPEAHYLTAVTLGSVVFSYLCWSFGFLKMGTTGLLSQAYGRQGGDEVRSILGQALLIAFFISIFLWLSQSIIIKIAMAFFEASNQSEHLMTCYIGIRIWGAPLTLTNYVLMGVFIAFQKTRALLILLMGVNLTNILLNVIFVRVLGLDVDGVALASVAAECIGCMMGIVSLTQILKAVPGQWHLPDIVQVARLKRTIADHSNIFIRTLCLISVFALFAVVGSTMGDAVVATNAILLNMQAFMSYALDGFAHAAEALCGKAVGERNRSKLFVAIKTVTLLSLMVSVMFALVYALCGESILGLITSIDSVKHLAQQYQVWIVLLPIISVWSYVLDGVFIGLMQTRSMRDGMLVSLLGFILIIVTFLNVLGNHALWLAFMGFMVMRALTLFRSLLRLDNQGALFIR